MADNLKLTVRALYSKNTDYSSPKVDFNPTPFTATPDEYVHFEVACDDDGETFDTSMFSGGVSLLVIKNNDAVIAVTARIDTAATANVDVVIPAGGMFITPDFKVSEDIVLTSASGAPECEVLIVGT